VCKLKVGGWDVPLKLSDEKSCPNTSRATEGDLDRALEIIHPSLTVPNKPISYGTLNTKPEPAEDLVNHPNHYTNGGIECIDEMILIFGIEATMHFCLLNAWKYRRRALDKNGQQDMDKSHWYINKYKELKGVS
jgi:hypothetical protein